MTVRELISILSKHDGDAEISTGIDEIDDEPVLIIYDKPDNADKQTKIKL